MSKIYITDRIDHDVMYDAEQVSYTPEIREVWDRQKFVHRRMGLPALGFAIDGKCIGGLYVEHGFLHVSVIPEYYGKWASIYLRGLEWALSHADPLYAGIIENNKRCIRFAEHSGWERVGRYNGVAYFRSNRNLLNKMKERRSSLETDEIV